MLARARDADHAQRVQEIIDNMPESEDQIYEREKDHGGVAVVLHSTETVTEFIP